MTAIGDLLYAIMVKGALMSTSGAAAGGVAGPIGSIIGAVAGSALAASDVGGKGIVHSAQEVANNPNNMSDEEYLAAQQSAAVSRANTAEALQAPSSQPKGGLGGGGLDPNHPQAFKATYSQQPQTIASQSSTSATPIPQTNTILPSYPGGVVMSDRNAKKHIKSANKEIQSFLIDLYRNK
jgi:hypothetical protein